VRWSVCAALAWAVAVSATASATSDTSSHDRTFRTLQLRLVDRTRTIRLPDGRRAPRRLDTTVRYPVASGPRPLVVFAHGFALTTESYNGLLTAWVRAGYVVAAPRFPLERPDAPGGPSRSDLVNEPGDVRFVISRLLALAARRGALGGRIDQREIAVAGHSDGGVAVLAVAFDRRFRDRRIRAAIVMSGAPLPGMAGFPPGSPPLLAVQGTADTLNAPATTASFFRRARRPKFLLWLLGASHRRPYQDQQPQLGIVERATAAFLGHYLGGRPIGTFVRAANRRGLTRLVAEP